MLSRASSFPWARRTRARAASAARLSVLSRRADRPTIFATATAPGRAALAVVRVSGPGARTVVETMLEPRPELVLARPRTALRRRVVSPRTGEVLDDALALWFPGPGSFTGEDVLELQVHGSRAVLGAVLDSLGSVEGLRPASAGEFTRRAFESGKLDLTEVEGLADLLNADTDEQRRLALSQLGGSLSSLYEGWRERVLRCLAHAEAVIDFGEDHEDVNEAVFAKVGADVEALVREVERHLADGRRGEIVREGANVAIVGPPNAGKSSLLNAFAQREVAIVSDIPGTTRDVLQVQLDLGGLSVRLSDTAGIRETEDVVEKEGVRRAHLALADADVRLCVFDVRDLLAWYRSAAGSTPLSLSSSSSSSSSSSMASDSLVWGWIPSPWRELVQPGSVVVVNKTDVVASADRVLIETALEGQVPGVLVRFTSCRDGFGLAELLEVVESRLRRQLDGVVADSSVVSSVGSGSDARSTTTWVGGGAVLTRARHRHHVEECRNALRRFLAVPESIDMAAEELRLASQSLGEITGRVDVEEVLDIVFRDFCIGK